MSDILEAAKTLINRLNSVANYDTPPHVGLRLAFLIGDQLDDDCYVDVVNKEGSDRRLVGQAIVMTATHVAVANWHTPMREAGNNESSVNVESWSRDKLCLIEIAADPAGHVNFDKDWLSQTVQSGNWPWSGQLSLTYSEPAVKLSIPLSPATSSGPKSVSLELVRTLMDDLK